jgi:phosphoserine phosphatase
MMKAEVFRIPMQAAQPNTLARSPIRYTTEEFHSAVTSLTPRIAVFDCDGTLWDGDAGYGFMLWSIETGLVSRNASDWIDSRYRLYRTGEVSERGICGEMTQMYAGLDETELRRKAAEYFRSKVEDKIFPAMRRLVAALHESGTELWAVSSTNDWVIEEGMKRFGIPPERVLCARVEIHNGRITSNLIDVPTDEGKATALDRAGVTAPDVVFGNSIHDAAMMELARQAFPVNPTPALEEIAELRQWPLYFPLVEEALSAR